MSNGGLRGLLRDAELRSQRDPRHHEVDDLVASEEARRSLRKAARLASAGFPQEVDEATRRRLSPLAIKACGKVGEFWRLKPHELASLLTMTSIEYDAARASHDRAMLEPAQFDRAGLLIEIFLTLTQLFVGELAYDWPRLPNKGRLFGGRSPIELMQSGDLECMHNVLGHLFALAGGLQNDISEPDQNVP